MPLITEDLDIWNFVYPIIEESMPDVQVIVHIPLEEKIIEVLDHIGGEINAFQQERPIIRFAQNNPNSDK